MIEVGAINNYSSYVVQNKEDNTKKNTAEKTTGMLESSKSESMADYLGQLAKLAPSVEFRVGDSLSSAKNGKTLTINSKLLEKMQSDPKQEKETKELIRGVEAATKLFDGIYKSSGWSVVFRHSYIDENGKYYSCAYVRNEAGYKMSEKLREERRENIDKLIEKTKEKAAKRREDLQESLEEKNSLKNEKESAFEKAEQLIEEKTAASKDGMIYLYDTDIKSILEAMKEENAGKNDIKDMPQIGANVDLQV